MRTFLLAGAFMGVILTAELLPGDSSTEAERIARLIQQLGDDDFTKRETASEELEAIGDPALAAVRKAATSADAEIRSRAERIVQAIAARPGKKELAKWEGSWEAEGGVWMKFVGDSFSSGTPTFGPVSGKIRIIAVREKLMLADLVIEAGPTKGQTAQAIFRRDGETLDYCGTYGPTRPTDFRTEGAYYHAAFKRAKSSAAHQIVEAVA